MMTFIFLDLFLIALNGSEKQTTYVNNSNHRFKAPVNISNNLDDSRSPAIARDKSGKIFVVWQNDIPRSREIYLSHSTDNGATWNQAVNISNSQGVSSKPDIAVDNSGGINVVWHESAANNVEVYFSRSIDNGASWTRPVNISNNSGYSTYPAVAANKSSNISVVWNDSNREIYFSHSTDNGINWTRPINISNSPRISEDADIAVDSFGNINVTWNNSTSKNHEIYFRRSTDNGANWNQIVNVSNNSSDSRSPAIAADSVGNLDITWSENFPVPHKSEIYFCRSTDGGVIWIKAVNISNNLEASNGPTIAADRAGNINVVWVNGLSSKNYEIYFSCSTSHGASWSQALNISNNPGWSEGPAITSDSAGNIYVAWWYRKNIYFSNSLSRK